MSKVRHYYYIIHYSSLVFDGKSKYITRFKCLISFWSVFDNFIDSPIKQSIGTTCKQCTAIKFVFRLPITALLLYIQQHHEHTVLVPECKKSTLLPANLPGFAFISPSIPLTPFTQNSGSRGTPVVLHTSTISSESKSERSCIMLSIRLWHTLIFYSCIYLNVTCRLVIHKLYCALVMP